MGRSRGVLLVVLAAALRLTAAVLVACGDFRIPADYVAAWNGTGWTPLTPPSTGLRSGPGACVGYNRGVVAGGGPSFVDNGSGGVAHGLAFWNGNVWRPLGGGLKGATEFDVFGNAVAVDALNVNNVYVGGQFTSAGDVPARSVALWDGTRWSALGDGLAGAVEALIATTNSSSGARLVVAGGDFLASGTVAMNRVAQWTGQRWVALGTGVNSNVYALAQYRGAVIAGGLFTSPALLLAQWDGAAWSTVGGSFSSASGLVTALAAVDGALLVGGTFYLPGQPSSLSYVARWNGATWTQLASSPATFTYPTFVETFYSYRGALMVGGFFTRTDGTQAGNVVQWTGSAWTVIGTGATGAIQDLVNGLAEY